MLRKRLNLLLPAAINAEVLVILVGFLFDIAAIAKPLSVAIFLFRSDDQEGIEFLELSSDSRTGLFFITHIEVSNGVAVSTQDDALLDFFLDPFQTISPLDCFTDVKHLVF